MTINRKNKLQEIVSKVIDGQEAAYSRQSALADELERLSEYAMLDGEVESRSHLTIRRRASIFQAIESKNLGESEFVAKALATPTLIKPQMSETNSVTSRKASRAMSVRAQPAPEYKRRAAARPRRSITHAPHGVIAFYEMTPQRYDAD